MTHTPWKDVDGATVWWDPNAGVRLWMMHWLDADKNVIGTEYDANKAPLLQRIRDHVNALGPIDVWASTMNNPLDENTDEPTKRKEDW